MSKSFATDKKVYCSHEDLEQTSSRLGFKHVSSENLFSVIQTDLFILKDKHEQYTGKINSNS